MSSVMYVDLIQSARLWSIQSFRRCCSASSTNFLASSAVGGVAADGCPDISAAPARPISADTATASPENRLGILPSRFENLLAQRVGNLHQPELSEIARALPGCFTCPSGQNGQSTVSQPTKTPAGAEVSLKIVMATDSAQGMSSLVVRVTVKLADWWPAS